MKKLVVFVYLLFAVSLVYGSNLPVDTLIIEDGWSNRLEPQKDSIVYHLIQEKEEMIILPDTHYRKTEVKVIKSSTPHHQRTVEVSTTHGGKSHISNSGVYYRPFEGHWSGIYFGFTDFSKSATHLLDPQYMELDYGRSITFKLNVLQQDFSLSKKKRSGLITGLGFEYQRLMFDSERFSITKDGEGKIVPKELPHGINLKRNVFKIVYLNIPFIFEKQFGAPRSYGDRFYINMGVIGGMRILSRTKTVYKLEGKKHKDKEKGSFNLLPFKADAHVAIGFGHIGIWGTYTFTRLFRESKGPELNPYTIGVGYHF